MANFETSPEFTEQIRKFETVDPAHADLFNGVIGALLNNDVFLKNFSEQLIKKIEQHAADKDNPHDTNKDQLGIGKVNNTSDEEKPVSIAQQAAIDAAYQQSTGYTNHKIADLINGAPSTLDTLGEIAKAMQDNANVVDALEAAIGTKASQAELDGHAGNSTIHITSSERKKWNDGSTNMTAATASAAGKAGLVPAPPAGSQNQFLAGNATWKSPFTPQAITTADTDLNDYTTPGMYFFTSSYTPANIPVGVNGWLIVMPYSATTIKQIWMRQGTVGGNDYMTYVRMRSGVSWSDWKRFAMDDDDLAMIFTSGDSTNPTGWADIATVTSGEKRSSLWRKFSLAVKNLRYLWKLMGTTDISDIGDGTICGAISELNMGIKGKQATITGAATTITGNNLTASRIMVTNASGKVSVSSVASSDLGNIAGGTSNFQTQINALDTRIGTLSGLVSAIPLSVFNEGPVSTTEIFRALSAPIICLTSTERISNKPTGKYGVIVIFKYSDTRAGAICICKDGTVYHNVYNPNDDAAIGWK